MNKVKVLLAQGHCNQRVADAVGCSLATLKRYFRAELDDSDKMRDRLEAELMTVAAEKAMTGNPTSLRVFSQMMERSDRMKATRGLAGATDSARDRIAVERPGKKDAKKNDAAAAISGNPDLFGKPRSLN